jgi:hypothetical protein
MCRDVARRESRRDRRRAVFDIEPRILVTSRDRAENSIFLNVGCARFDPCPGPPPDVTETVAIHQADAGSGAGVVDASIDDLSRGIGAG